MATLLWSIPSAAGHIETQSISDLSFKEQQRSFDVLGYAANPSIMDGSSSASTSAFVGNVHEAWRNAGDLLIDRKITKSATRAMKRKRKGKGTLGEFEDEDEEEEDEVPLAEGEIAPVGENSEPVVTLKREKKDRVQKEYLGPWAGWEDERASGDGGVGPTEEEWEEQAIAGGAPLSKKQRVKAILDEGKRQIGFGEEKSIYHGVSSSYLIVSTCFSRG